MPLDLPPADLPDDDPDMLAGMERLRVLREGEGDVVELQVKHE